ncbi:uncharacterized protein PV09_01281 [Verruconis gallopava]|uniref:L domain-like protein n=1 Tax=Verruconis gallopava TaxID=253628 RepID=A0A0D2AP84_9PEZI|nr:uncharacterized protein PV09_01281 [Verruconis gallopava]KIW08365.1 hypothetical protein PV09_01281 [Verruconis gallopava]
MDLRQAASQPTSSGNPSALPRPAASKLPLPRSSVPNLRQQPSLSSISRPTNASAARRQASTASLAQKARPPLSHTQPNDRAPAHLRNASAALSAGQDASFKKPSTRPLSRTNVQAKQRQASAASSKGSILEDDLGSHRSFQSDATYSTNATSPSTTPVTPTFRKASRPSLSERTIESLASIPPSPAGSRRKSSFFTSDSPMKALSRPASAIDNRSRPSSKDKDMPPPLTTTPRALATKPSLPNLSSSVRGTPNRFPLGNTAKTIRARSPTKSSLLKTAGGETATTAVSAKPVVKTPVRGSKTVAGRIQQQRAPVADLFGEGVQKSAPVSKPTSRPVVKKSAPPSAPPKEEATPSPKATQAAKSSASLREQIRAAKAARLSSNKQEIRQDSIPDFDPSAFADPFNTKPKDERSAIRIRIDTARSDGKLNISAMGLKEIPEEVLKMYDYDFNKDSDTQWNEVVDLTRFIAADNEIETIPDAVFPDVDVNAYNENDDTDTPKFGGVELLDLHGNNLFDVPIGLRRLDCLTTLNLSRNRLMNDALETIAQISSLRELKIADNLLTGELTSIESLTKLEVLDVRGNKLSVLPDEIRDLVRLRYLNVSNNQLTSLPMTELSNLPLIELYASKNKLSGALFTTPGVTMSRIQTLDVSVNQLSALCSGTSGPELPNLRILNVAFNAITALPAISSWTELTTILAEDNKIMELPVGFTDASSLRNADFTGNDMAKLDERIALMDGLESFKVAANPLRERKFLTMSTTEIKKALAERLGPASFLE